MRIFATFGMTHTSMRGIVAKDIDDYIKPFPTEVKALLEQMRQTIRKAAPKATEGISYMMPAFDQHGKIVYFAGYKNHIGFYPTSSGIKEFQTDLAKYETSKGAIRFPLDKPLPLALITRIVKFRVMENVVKAELKKDNMITPVKKKKK